MAVLGVGLIGGSIGWPRRSTSRTRRSWASAATRSGSGAVERGAIQRATASSRRRSRAPSCFACAPWALPGLVRAALDASGPDTLVTDVGSTKQTSAARRPALRRRAPDRGRRDRRGRARTRDPFQDAVWYLAARAVRRAPLRAFHRSWSTWARGLCRDAATHDRLVAGALPARARQRARLAGAARLSEHGEALRQVGPSFRDMTRVAGANTAMWSDIYRSNRAAIVEEIRGFRRELDEVERRLEAGEVEDWNDRARRQARAP